MSEEHSPASWHFHKFGLLVTGKGEEEFLPHFLRSLCALTGGRCEFKVIRKIGQRSPITSAKKKLKMIGTGKTIPDLDADEIGLPARQYLGRHGERSFVLLIDDLEHDRRGQEREIFRRYRDALCLASYALRLVRRSRRRGARR